MSIVHYKVSCYAYCACVICGKTIEQNLIVNVIKNKALTQTKALQAWKHF